jgi:hypothetical protein
LAIVPEDADEQCPHELIEIWGDAARERNEVRASMRGRCIACGDRLLRTREAGGWTSWRSERGMGS